MPPKKKISLDDLDVPVLDSPEQKTNSGKVSLDQLDVPDVSAEDNSGHAPRQPQSLQTATGNAPNEVYADILDNASKVAQTYLGSNSTPDVNKPVVITGTTEKGNKATDVYTAKGEAGRVTNKEGNDLSVDNSKILNPQQVQQSRNDINAETNSVNNYFLKDYQENAQAINNYSIRPQLQPLPQADNTNPQQKAQLLQSVPTQPQEAAQSGQQPVYTPPAQNPTFGENSGQNIQRVLNPEGDKEALTDYYNARLKVLADQKKTDLEAAQQQYDQATEKAVTTKGPESQDAADARIQQFNDAQKNVEEKYKQTEDQLNQATFNLATIKSVNSKLKDGIKPENIDPYQVGLEVSGVLGNEQQNELRQKDLEQGRLNPAEKVAAGIEGYNALQYAAHYYYGKGQDDIAKTLMDKSNDYLDKLRSENPEFVQQQKLAILGDEIYKNLNPIRTIFGNLGYSNYGATEEDIQDAAKRLGWSEDQIKGINPADVPFEKFGALGRATKGLINTTVTPLYEMAIARPEWQYLTGPEKQKAEMNFNQNWFNKSIGGQFLGESPQASTSIIGAPTTQEKNPQSQQFLFDVANPEVNAMNKNWRAYLGATAQGVGEMAGFMGEGGVIGKGVEGLNLVSTPQKAEKIGSFFSMFFPAYNNAHASAYQAIGDKPEDEGKRNLYAWLNGTIAAATGLIMSPAELRQNIFSPQTQTGQEFINYIKDNSWNAIKSNPSTLADLVTKGTAEWAKEQGKIVSASMLMQLGDNVTQMALAKDSKTSPFDNVVQAGVQAGVAFAIPTFISSISKVGKESQLHKDLLYTIGNDPNRYLQEIKNLQEKGDITPEEANKKSAIVHTMANIVSNSVPQESAANNEPLTIKQKVDYANNLLNQSLLEAKKDASKDEIQEKHIDEAIKNLKQQRTDILENAGEKKAVQPEVAPIENTPATTVEELLKQVEDAPEDIFNPNTNSNEQNSKAEEANAQEGQKGNVLNAPQTTEEGGVNNATPSVIDEEKQILGSNYSAYKEAQRVSNSDNASRKDVKAAIQLMKGIEANLSDEERNKLHINSSIKLTENATQNSQELQNKGLPQQSSEPEHPGTPQPRNEAPQQPADNSRSDISQQEEVNPEIVSHFSDIEKIQDKIENAKSSKVKKDRKADLEEKKSQLPDNVRKVVDNEKEIIRQLKDLKKLKIEC